MRVCMASLLLQLYLPLSILPSACVPKLLNRLHGKGKAFNRASGRLHGNFSLGRRLCFHDFQRPKLTMFQTLEAEKPTQENTEDKTTYSI